MAYADLIADIREALGVTSSHDTSIANALTRNARYFLRNFNFRESVRRGVVLALALNATSFALPADAGKIKAVRLRQLSAGTYLYRRLRRREEGQLPTTVIDGVVMPSFYWYEGGSLYLDAPLREAGLDAEIWYQTADPTTAESWLSTTYGDVLTHRTIYELAPTKRKPEAMQIYSALWQEDMSVLANYLQELEFGDLEMRMGEPFLGNAERYPSL